VSTPAKSRPKPRRSCRLLELDGRRVLALSRATARTLTEMRYHLTAVPSDFGRAFRLEKLSSDGEGDYHVLLHGPETSCECLGFLRHGHCKHAESLMALAEAGLL
jgi:hypothetical protein